MSLAEHKDATKHENDRGDDHQLLEVLVGVITTPERVLAPHVYNVDKAPAINAQTHKCHKLRQGKPSCIHCGAEIPILVEI